jgi:hypothetical protein
VGALHPRFSSGPPQLQKRYTDEGDCQSGDCTRYRADGVWHDRYVGVKVENHAHGVVLHKMYHNFVRIPKTLRVTPAMAAALPIGFGRLQTWPSS